MNNIKSNKEPMKPEKAKEIIQSSQADVTDTNVGKLYEELNYWKREAIADKAKLGEIRILMSEK